jgi:prepilin-type N-terminal cleavage/methylation domain-containing protein
MKRISGYIPQKNGFSAVELLIVLAVIAFLTAGILWALLGGEDQAKNSQIKNILTDARGIMLDIRETQGSFNGYSEGKFANPGLRDMHEQVKNINGVGFDDTKRITTSDRKFAIITPTENAGAMLCFTTEHDATQRIDSAYNPAVHYTDIVRENDWECPDEITVDNRPEFSIPTTPYTEGGITKTSEWVTPEDYNIELTLEASNGDIKNDQGSGWQSAVTMNPGEQFRLRSQSPSSGTKTVPVSVQTRSDVSRDWKIAPYRASCKDILEANPDASSGEYMIDPDENGGTYDAFPVQCEMDKAGGGWTRITKRIAKEELIEPVRPNDDDEDHVQWVSGDPGTDKGFLNGYRPYFQDEGAGGAWSEGIIGDTSGYTGYYDIPIPFGYDRFYLDNAGSSEYQIMSWAGAHPSGSDGCLVAGGGQPDTSEFGFGFDRTEHTWETKEIPHGDIAFGSPKDTTAVTSFSKENPGHKNLNTQSMYKYETDTFDATGEIFSVNTDNANTFRISSTEQTCQKEGWVPWNSGYIYVR